MKHNSFDKNCKDVYGHCFRKFTSYCFIATIALNWNFCHLIFSISKLNFEEIKIPLAFIEIRIIMMFLHILRRKNQVSLNKNRKSSCLILSGQWSLLESRFFLSDRLFFFWMLLVSMFFHINCPLRYEGSIFQFTKTVFD